MNDMLFDPRHFLSSLLDDSAEFNQVNTALISIFKIDAKGIHFRYALSALNRMWFHVNSIYKIVIIFVMCLS